MQRGERVWQGWMDGCWGCRAEQPVAAIRSVIPSRRADMNQRPPGFDPLADMRILIAGSVASCEGLPFWQGAEHRQDVMTVIAGRVVGDPLNYPACKAA